MRRFQRASERTNTPRRSAREDIEHVEIDTDNREVDDLEVNDDTHDRDSEDHRVDNEDNDEARDEGVFDLEDNKADDEAGPQEVHRPFQLAPLTVHTDNIRVTNHATNVRAPLTLPP